MADPAYNETLLAMLTEIGKRRGYFVLPIVRHLPSLRIIDGYHRLEVIRRLEEEDSSIKIGHCFRDVEVDDPDTLAIELNKARRPWDDAEERRTQAQILAATPVPGGRKGKGGGKNGKPPSGTVAPPSTRQIADVLGVDHATVLSDLRGTGKNPPVGQMGHLDPDKLARLEQLYREHAKPDGRMPHGKGRDWLAEQTGLTPKNVRTWLEKQTKTTTTTTLSTTATNGTLEAATAELEADDSTLTTDPTEHFNAEQLRDHCAAEVAKSDRPDDYKRAIQLLAELDHIVTAAWRRQHPEPWIAGDWSHISGELQALHSIAYQRAVELNKPIFEKFTAVTVAASFVS